MDATSSEDFGPGTGPETGQRAGRKGAPATGLTLTADRLAEVEAKCVAQGIVLQAIVALLPEHTVQELKAAATSVDDEGMQEANPDPQLRRIAAQIRHLLQLL